MPSEPETTLLRDFVADRCESAFEGLVAYHIKMVFGCALRRTGNRSLAEDVSQAVFTILARKAHKLVAADGLAPWLYQTTLYEANKALRGEARRQRKMKALAEHTQQQVRDEAEAINILPVVDEAIRELPESDRRAILLHYFEGRTFREMAQSLGKSEAASQKQTSRAIRKLRALLQRQGVMTTATVLGAALAAESAKAVPVGIITTVSGNALTGASSISTSAIIANTLQTMTYAKTKTALLVAAMAAVPIGIQMHTNKSLQQHSDILEQAVLEQKERLGSLEDTFAAMPAGLMAQVLESAPGDAKRILTDIQHRLPTPPSPAGSSVIGIRASKATNEPRNGDEETVPTIPGLEAFGDAMENPVMRRMVAQQLKMQINANYGDLFDYLKLDESKRQELVAALHDKTMAMANSMSSSDGAEPDIAIITGKSAEYDTKIRKLLGDENYEAFDLYEKSSSERAELAILRETLEEEGKAMPFETEQKLMAIMYEEGNSQTATPSVQRAVDTEQPLSVIQYQREIQTRVRKRVAEFLTNDQLEAFAKNQDNHLDHLKIGLEAANQQGINVP